MKRKRFHSSEPENQPNSPALKIASAAFFAAFFAWLWAALFRRLDGLDGTIPLLLAVVNLCLSLIYGQRCGGYKREKKRRFKNRRRGRQSWHS